MGVPSPFFSGGINYDYTMAPMVFLHKAILGNAPTVIGEIIIGTCRHGASR